MRQKVIKQKLFDAITQELHQREYPHSVKQQVFTFAKRYISGDNKWFNDVHYMLDRVTDRDIKALASDIITRAENTLIL